MCSKHKNQRRSTSVDNSALYDIEENDHGGHNPATYGCYGGIGKYLQEFSDRLQLSRSKTRPRSEEFLSPRRSFRDFFGLRLDKKKTRGDNGGDATSGATPLKACGACNAISESSGGPSQFCVPEDIAQLQTSSGMMSGMKSEMEQSGPAMTAIKSKLAFIKASQKGDLNTLHSLVRDSGISVRDEHMALHFASDANKSDIVQFLLDRGADINSTDSKDRTALMYAAYRGNTEAITVLIEKGADLDCQDRFGSTALMYAATGGKDEICKLMLAKGARIDMVNKDGFSCLVYAVEGGSASTTQLLLDHGADHNVENSSGTGILHWAAKRGHVECCRILIQNGVDVDTRNHRRVTPLMYAADSRACTASNRKVLEYLIEMGADVNAQDEDLSNPVMYAAHSGSWKNVQVLLSHGADPKNSNKYETTPMMYAAFHGYIDIVSLLLQEEMDLKDATDNCGMSVEDWAREGKHTEVVAFLNQLSTLPLHWSPETHSQFPIAFRRKVQHLLISFKADPSKQRLPDEIIYEVIKCYWNDLIFDATHPDREQVLGL